MPELTLDDDQWHTFMRHLDRMCVAELMRREPATYARRCSGSSQLLTCG